MPCRLLSSFIPHLIDPDESQLRLPDPVPGRGQLVAAGRRRRVRRQLAALLGQLLARAAQDAAQPALALRKQLAPAHRHQREREHAPRRPRGRERGREN